MDTNEMLSIAHVLPLPPEVARKIAAGEVIDRPAAIVRELIDNALDACAQNITVEVENGGIEKIRVIDDGFGMTKTDLEHCALPHTTSKIRQENDLLSLHTLGFRGEALSSISAVSRLEITTIRLSAEQSHGWKLENSIGLDGVTHTVSAAHIAKGTIVQATALFENFPARRQFLKRASSEASACKQTFIEKVLPQYDKEFRLKIDGKDVLHLTSVKNHTERLVSALSLQNDAPFFSETSIGGKGFSGTIVLGHVGVTRKDRKDILIFINNRRIWEYSLVQAIEYGATGYFPNGTHPIACLFLDLDPALVDFNIHPAKKEARFKDISTIHHAVSTAVRTFYASQTVRRYTDAIVDEIQPFNYKQADLPVTEFEANRKGMYSNGISHRAASYDTINTDSYMTDVQKTYERASASLSKQKYGAYSASYQTDIHSRFAFRYVGQVLGVFLVIEKDDSVYLLDQHAVHERLLFDEILNGSPEVQELLVPYIIETETPEQDAFLSSQQESLIKAGFILNDEKNGQWVITGVPQKWTGSAQQLQEDILTNVTAGNELLYAIAARSACRAAVMDGDVVDAASAIRLAEQAFALSPDSASSTPPCCPHGRPLWVELTKEHLFKAVKRT